MRRSRRATRDTPFRYVPRGIVRRRDDLIQSLGRSRCFDAQHAGCCTVMRRHESSKSPAAKKLQGLFAYDLGAALTDL